MIRMGPRALHTLGKYCTYGLGVSVLYSGALETGQEKSRVTLAMYNSMESILEFKGRVKRKKEYICVSTYLMIKLKCCEFIIE